MYGRKYRVSTDGKSVKRRHRLHSIGRELNENPSTKFAPKEQRTEFEMPEGPEVATLASQIAEELGGSSAESLKPWNMRLEYYQAITTDKKTRIRRLQRVGKYICLYGDDWRFLVHLRMSGRVHLIRSLEGSADQLAVGLKHCKAILTMMHDEGNDKSFRLAFTDSRGFGVYNYAPWADPSKDVLEIRRLGPDVTSPSFSIEALVNALAPYPNKTIAGLMLDQEIISGIGNIYRSEILFACGIHPARRVGSLSEDAITAIYEETVKKMAEAILHNGCSMLDHRSTYADLYGRKGGMGHRLFVYQKEGMRCLSCGVAEITMMNLEKLRRVYYCPNCQV